MNSDRIKEILTLKPLELEGGSFRETIRSKNLINADFIHNGYGGQRALFTVIYYMIEKEGDSAPHKLRSDEIWFFHEGDPIEIAFEYPDGEKETKILGANIESGQSYQLFIPAGTIQHAKLGAGINGYALVSCVVVPGFEFEDFEIATEDT